jgi:hypothetical protein
MPFTGFVAAFYEGLSRRQPRLRAATYRRLVLLGYALACLEVALLAVMLREPRDFAWALYGAVAGGALGVLIIYLDSGIVPHDSKMFWAVRLGFGIPLYLWAVLYLEPMAATREGEFMLVGFLLGWTLGWAVPGNLYHRYKLAVERAERGRPASVLDEEAVRMKGLLESIRLEHMRILRRNNLLKSSALLIATSAGIMLWAATDMALDPEFDTLEGVIVWYPLMVSALVVLLVGLVKGECRLMMVAGTLAGFSFLGPLAAAGQVMLWVDHRRFGLPWKAAWDDEDGPDRQLEERWVAEVREVRQAVARKSKDLGLMLEVYGSRSGTIQKEAELMRRDLERVQLILLALPRDDPRAGSGRLERVDELIGAARALETCAVGAD